jgi:hypothetical protein
MAIINSAAQAYLAESWSASKKPEDWDLQFAQGSPRIGLSSPEQKRS